MRISKSTKTSVKASTDKCSYAYWQEEIMDERLAGLDSDAKYEEYLKWKNNNCKDVETCGVKASTISNTDISKMSTTELFNYIHDNMKETFAPGPEESWIRKFCDVSGISRDEADANYWHNTEIPNNPTANRKIIDYLKSINACGDVKAARTAKEKFLGTALLEDRGDGKIHLYNFPVAPNDRCRYMWNNTMFPTTWNTIDEAINAIETTLGVRVDREQIIHPTDASTELYLYGTNKAIMSTTTVAASIDSDINRYKKSLEKKAAKSGVYENFGADEIRKLRDKYSVYQDDVTDYRTAQHNLNSLNSFEDWCANYVGATTANDKALKYIKAAIDILGKSGDKSDVTKDSIANLATVLFDIQSGTDTKKK